MNAVVTPAIVPFDLAHLAPPRPSPLEAVLSASGSAFMGVFAPSGDAPDPSALRAGITRAAAFLDGHRAQAAALREAAELAPIDEIGRQVGRFVTAWPNASGTDLAGYGAQLAEDVIERRPCRYALRAALRQLRHTSRFLPAIAEVLTALDAAQARVRNTLWHVERLPVEIERARAELARAEAFEAARHARGEGAPAVQPGEGSAP